MSRRVLILVALLACQVVAQPALVELDVRVVSGDGKPVAGLTANQFQLSLGGNARPLASAEYSVVAEGKREFVLVIDASSFSELEAPGVTVAAQAFVDRAPETESIAVRTYPEGPAVPATLDRVAIRKALSGLTSRRTGVTDTPYRRTLDAIRAVVREPRPALATTYVLLSASGDALESPAPKPEAAEAPAAGGRAVLDGDAALYTVFLGHEYLELTLPPKPGAQYVAPSPARDDPELQSWLAQLSAAAGGNLIKVAGFRVAPAFDRIIDETSASYRLRLPPVAAGDATGNLSIKIAADGAVVRRAVWIRDGLPAAPAAPASPAAAFTPPPSIGRARVNAVLGAPAVSGPVVDAYVRGDFVAMRNELGQVADLPRWIRNLRNAGRPWPTAPAQNAAFALGVLDSALAMGDEAALTEALDLVNFHASSMRDRTAPEFQCAWYWGALMLFEGAGEPDGADPIVEKARARCPSDSHVALAMAFLADIQAPVLGIRSGRAAETEAKIHQRVLDLYEAARQFPDTALEASVRKAWLLFRLKSLPEALTLTDTLPPAGGSSADDLSRQVIYAGYFVRGQILREQGQVDRAAAAYRQATVVWPEAQAPRIALMTLLATAGRRSEAEPLAAAIESAPANATDPWWWFWQGDRQRFAGLISKLRQEK